MTIFTILGSGVLASESLKLQAREDTRHRQDRRSIWTDLRHQQQTVLIPQRSRSPHRERFTVRQDLRLHANSQRKAARHEPGRSLFCLHLCYTLFATPATHTTSFPFTARLRCIAVSTSGARTAALGRRTGKATHAPRYPDCSLEAVLAVSDPQPIS